MAALPAESQVFLATAAIFGAIGVVYAVTDAEPAGLVLLFGSAIVSLTYAFYLGRHVEEVQESVAAQEEGEVPNELYLPHQSLWPVGLGAGGVLVCAGFAVGTWVLVAGALLMARSVVGFVVEGRERR